MVVLEQRLRAREGDRRARERDVVRRIHEEAPLRAPGDEVERVRARHHAGRRERRAGIPEGWLGLETLYETRQQPRRRRHRQHGDRSSDLDRRPRDHEARQVRNGQAARGHDSQERPQAQVCPRIDSGQHAGRARHLALRRCRRVQHVDGTRSRARPVRRGRLQLRPGLGDRSGGTTR